MERVASGSDDSAPPPASSRGVAATGLTWRGELVYGAPVPAAVSERPLATHSCSSACGHGCAESDRQIAGAEGPDRARAR